MTVVVLVPGMGDDVQAIKAGIMEIADIFVINKADHPGADRVELELHAEGFDLPRRCAPSPPKAQASPNCSTRSCRRASADAAQSSRDRERDHRPPRHRRRSP